MSDSYRWLCSHLDREAHRLLIGSGALVVASFVNFRTGASLRNAIEDVQHRGRGNAAVSGLLLFGVGAVAGCVRTLMFDVAYERIRASMADQVFTSLLRMEPEAAPRTAEGASEGKITEEKTDDTKFAAAALELDITTCAEAVQKLGNVARYMSSVVGGTYAMFSASWKLSALVWPLFVMGAMRGARAGSKTMGKHAKLISAARDDALNFAEERLQCVDLVRWFSRAEQESAEYRRKCGIVVDAASRAARGRGISWMVMDFVSKGTVLGLCSFGSLLVNRGDLSAAELVSFFFHSSFLCLGLYGLVGLAPQVVTTREAARRLVSVVHASNALPSGEEVVASTLAPGALRFENVCFAYPSDRGSKVLENFSLEVIAGTSCALVGPSGCGKSTMLKLLLRDFDSYTGKITLDGDDIREMSREGHRAQISVCPQQSALLGDSIAAAIEFGVLAGDKGVPGGMETAARKAIAHDFVEAKAGGYGAAIGRGGALLSAGERSRVAAARSFMRSARVLILDEPTAALDAPTGAAFMEELLGKQEGRPTTIVITHSLSVIKRCDSVAVISQRGKPVQQGKFSDLVVDSEGMLSNIMKAGVLEDDTA